MLARISRTKSPARELIDGYMAAWESKFGMKYLWHGAADGKAASQLLAMGFTAESIISVAKLAWEHPQDFNCKQAVTMRGLRSRFNEIRIAVDSQKQSEPKEELVIAPSYIPYSKRLQDPRWQKKRLEILNRDSFTCRMCDDTLSTLHVHHRSYVKGKDPWDYEDSNFLTLCCACHEQIEMVMKNVASLKALIGSNYVCTVNVEVWHKDKPPAAFASQIQKQEGN